MNYLLNKIKKKISFKKKGTVLIAALITLGLLLFLGSYFISFSLTGKDMAESDKMETKTYYLSEAGVQEAIYKLKNNSNWKSEFEDCNSWSISSYTRDPAIYKNGEYTIYVKKTGCAQAKLTVKAKINLNKSATSQRIVEVEVFKATGSLTKNSAIFGDGNVKLDWASNLTIHKGNIYSKSDIVIDFASTLNIYDNPTTTQQEGQALAGGNISLDFASELNSSSSCADNMCTELCEGYTTGSESCPPENIKFPMVDFYSDDSNSYLSKAEEAEANGQCSIVGKDSDGNTVITSDECVLGQDQFKNLLWEIGEGGTLYLEHKASGDIVSTYYVDGNVNVRGGREMVVDGVLVVDGNIRIGKVGWGRWRWGWGGGYSQITVNDPGEDIPSGLLATGNIEFGFYCFSKETRIEGLIYALGNLELISTPDVFEIYGGQIAAGNFYLSSIYQGMDIYLNNDIIKEGIWGGPKPPGEEKPPYSPTITRKHWEEEY